MFKNLSCEALGISGRDSEIIELVLSHGFKGLDLDLIDFAQQVQTQGMARASRLITSARLKIGSFRLPVRWEDEASAYQADLDRLPQLAEIAQQMGCTRAVTCIEPGNDSRPYHESFEFHRRRITEIAAALAPYKIRLGLGFQAPVSCRAGFAFQFVQTVDEVLQLLKMITAPNVGLAIDTWHWHLGRGTLDQLRALSAEKIVTLSLADAPPDATAANASLTSRRMPGEGGAIDVPAVFGALAELRYDGPVTLMPDKNQFAGLSREKIVRQVGAALDGVWKAAGLNMAGKLAAVPGR